MKFGLAQHIIDKLIAVFEENPKVDKALVFGSRAMGNYRPDSDIDIALKGQDLNTDAIIAMSVAFEEKGITHKVDLINYETINEPDLKDHIDRVGIEVYSRWKKVKLGALVQIKYGKDHKQVGNGNIPIFGSGGIMRYGDKALYEKQSILIPRKGSLNNIFYRDEPFWTVDTMFWTKINREKVYPKFLFYQLTKVDFENLNVGSAVPSLTVPVIEEIEINLPPLQEQTTIAATLSSLDDKINLLHGQNKTLEQLAETLFRQWFVEEGDIEFRPLKTFVDVIDNRGKTPPFSDIKTDFPIVEVKSLSNNDRFVNYEACEKYVNEETYKNWFRKGHPIKNDILISTVGSIGEMAFVIENKGGIAQNVVGLRAKNISPFYLYQFLSLTKTRREIKDLDIGAVQPSIKVPHLLDIEVPIPKNKNLIVEFEKQLIPMFEKMKVNHFQIKTLTQNRDTLLPKLMSGEVRVNL